MKIKTLLITFIVIVGLYYAYTQLYNHPTKIDPSPTTTSYTPAPYVLAQNDAYMLTTASQSAIDAGIPVDITVTSIPTQDSFVLPQKMVVSLGGYVKNDAAQTTLFYSTGTSHVRTAHLIDLVAKKESASFCHVGSPIFWKTYFIYEDCTMSEKLQSLRNFENGEYMPVVYKINLVTDEKTEVIKSDELHTYSVDTNRTYAENDPNFILHMTSVATLSDWADFTKWKEGEKVLNIK